MLAPRPRGGVPSQRFTPAHPEETIKEDRKAQQKQTRQRGCRAVTCMVLPALLLLPRQMVLAQPRPRHCLSKPMG